MNKKTLIVLAVLALLVSGCLLSGTFSFKVNLKNLEAAFENGFIKETVNLSEQASTWEEHEDEIAQIESIRLDAIVINNSQALTTLGVYISADSTLIQADFASRALPVLTGYKVPAQTTDTLTIPEALKLLHLSGDNWSAIQNLLKTGHFTAYASSSETGADIFIEQLNLYITFTTTN